jgi:hypothetical protein
MNTDSPTEFISAFETERLVQTLKKFNLTDIGGMKWTAQHETLEKLNIQAHKNINIQSEEYVSEAIINFEMVNLCQ